jgi:integrase
MSNRIRYAYLKQQTWLYRRNYPKDVALVLGVAAFKQSLKTSDPKLAGARAAEVNTLYEATVEQARSGLKVRITDPAWAASPADALANLRITLDTSEGVVFPARNRGPVPTVFALSREYLRRRGEELRPGGYKSVRYSVDLFSTKFPDRPVTSLTREDGRLFLSLVPRLSRLIGKSPATQGRPMDAFLAFSTDRRNWITPRTQKRIWGQVNHFLDWAVYNGHLTQNPFRTIGFEGKVKPAPYAVPTDAEVRTLLLEVNTPIYHQLRVGLLTGMRSDEAAGLLREGLIGKGNLGTFAHVRPNRIRELKTDASERVVPLHSELDQVLSRLPPEGPLFPHLSVNQVTRAFTHLREKLGLQRSGLVFHGTRKWFITQCERTGVPEHFTASLVGHQSARSENQLTYSIYSAGISDEQKRGIIDQIRLPC